MNIRVHPFSVVSLMGLGILGLSACQSNAKPRHVPEAYFSGNALDRHEIGVRPITEFLEVKFSPVDNGLRQEEIAKIKGFVAAYNSDGHGPLIMSMPRGTDSPQIAVNALAETRQIAWEEGIEYSQITGTAYDAGGRPGAPIVLAYKAYAAIVPDCKYMSEFDFADTSSNNDLPSLGCAVRNNIAAIIADPADLYGTRPLDDLDINRRTAQLELYREGQMTAARREEAEEASITE